MAKGSSTINVLASFTGGINGANPFGRLVLDSSGNLYGTTWYGGASGAGTIFEVANGSGTITTLASFNGNTEGAGPYAGLILDSFGNLYGTASEGGASGDGTIFELATGSQTITALASFSGTDGVFPIAPLIVDSSGNLYGTAIEGGSSGDGTIFELPKRERHDHHTGLLQRRGWEIPWGGLLMDGAGNLLCDDFPRRRVR